MSRWKAHPAQAWLIRAVVFVVPIAGSIAFVHFASGFVAVPTSSFLLFVSWWLGMSGAATVVLFGLERALRRLLPLVALYRLSLVFPDAAPSRFKAAMRSHSTATLAERVAEAKRRNDRSTSTESAERLLALVSQLDSHDRLTRGHSDRVRAYAQMIGIELHLNPSELELLNWSALLHDVGKLSVPSEILTKAGAPTDEEWDVLRRHPEFGHELIAPLREWLGEWSLAVVQHHENWDGSGYPNGVAGEEISLAARIVAVADVFDVITSARSYKSPFASAVAREEIARFAGTQFDPRVVRAFLNISLGRLRLVMGPLSWLAHAPILGRMPLTPAIGTVAGSVATVASAVATGLVAPPPPPVLASTTPPARSATLKIERVTREDERTVAGIEQAGGATVTSLRIAGQPTVGRARATAGHEIEYTPAPNFHGTVPIEYVVCWTGRGCGRGTLLIRVLAVNDAPKARDDRASTARGVSVEIDVLRNDSDVEGDALSILSVANLRGGATRIVGGVIRWTPRPGFVGTASFQYVATDGRGGTSTARVTVRVTGHRPAPRPAAIAVAPRRSAPATQPPPAPASTEPEPAAPEPASPAPAANRPPQARSDRLSVPEGGSVIVDVLANDEDPDGDQLSIASVGSSSRGAVRKVGDRVQFTAPSDYVGVVTFRYTVVDTHGSRAGAEVSISVLLVNVAPSFAAGPSTTVLEDAGPQTVSPWAASISPGPTSEAGQVVSFLVSNDNNGLFEAQPSIDSAGTLRYTPARGASGSALVTVRAKDNGGTANGGNDTSPPQTFTITVTAVNHAPTANADSASVAEDDPAGVTFNVLANDTDVDPGDTLSISSYDDASLAGGLLTANGGGSFTYVPNSDFFGTDTFSYTIKDGGGATNTAVVTLTVTPQPDAPEAAADAYTTPQSTSLTVAAPGILANDADADRNTLTVETVPIVPPTNGALAMNTDGSFTYTPTGAFVGTDTFTYRVDDGTGLTGDAVVRITVNSTVTATNLYFADTGPASVIWGMTTSPPPPVSPVPDYAGDGNPGLTIKHSDGSEFNPDPRVFKAWAYTTTAPLVLNGPVSLRLWSAIANFRNDRQGHPYAYLYDCAAGGTACVKIAENDAHVDPWSSIVNTWVFRTFTVGSVDRTIAAGRMLKLVLRFRHNDLWVAMTGAYPSGLTLTVG